MTDTELDLESVDGSFVPRRDGTVQLVPVDGEGILVGGDGGLHVLNPTATLLWECFDGDVTLAELADEIATELEVSSDEVLTDTIRLARDFVARGVLGDARLAALEQDEAPEPATGTRAAGDAPGAEPEVLAEPPNT